MRQATASSARSSSGSADARSRRLRHALIGALAKRGRRKRRTLGDRLVPGRKRLAIGAPVEIGIAKIEIAERAAGGDRADVDAVSPLANVLVIAVERVVDLGHLG